MKPLSSEYGYWHRSGSLQFSLGVLEVESLRDGPLASPVSLAQGWVIQGECEEQRMTSRSVPPAKDTLQRSGEECGASRCHPGLLPLLRLVRCQVLDVADELGEVGVT